MTDGGSAFEPSQEDAAVPVRPRAAPESSAPESSAPESTARESSAGESAAAEDAAPESSAGESSAGEGAAAPAPADGREPDAMAAATRGTSVATRRQPVLSPPPRPTGPRVVSPVRVPAREWGRAKATDPGYVGPETPADVKIVVGALIVTAVLAAVIVGELLSNALVAVVAALVLLLGLSGFLWMSRL